MQTKQVTIHQLNSLLCNLHTFYQNTRAFHWNIKGPVFFELHEKFEELYTYLSELIDEIAERIVALEGDPIFDFVQISQNSQIAIATSTVDSYQNLSQCIDSLKIIIEQERKIITESLKETDYGTVEILQRHLAKQEKLLWMYQSYQTGK